MALKKKHGADGFEILGFPCRQFAKQEFTETEKIRKFAAKYNCNFELLELCDVNGSKTHPVFAYCKWNAPPDAGFVNKNDLEKLGSIGWNFGKFLVDQNGGVCAYYGPPTYPSAIEEDIKKALKGELVGFRRDSEGQPVEGSHGKSEAKDETESSKKRAKA